MKRSEMLKSIKLTLLSGLPNGMSREEAILNVMEQLGMKPPDAIKVYDKTYKVLLNTYKQIWEAE